MKRLVFVSLLTTALAQFNLSLAVSELPICAVSACLYILFLNSADNFQGNMF